VAVWTPSTQSSGARHEFLPIALVAAAPSAEQGGSLRRRSTMQADPARSFDPDHARILVVGPMAGGKTTLVHSLCHGEGAGPAGARLRPPPTVGCNVDVKVRMQLCCLTKARVHQWLGRGRSCEAGGRERRSRALLLKIDHHCSPRFDISFRVESPPVRPASSTTARCHVESRARARFSAHDWQLHGFTCLLFLHRLCLCHRESPLVAA